MCQVMRAVVGVQERLRQGAWRFIVDHTQVKDDVVVKENESFFVSMVREKYRVVDPMNLVSLTS